MAINISNYTGTNNNTNSTFIYGANVNPGDLIIVQVKQSGGTAGSFNDNLNNYTLYSSNDNTGFYSFYSIAASRFDGNSTITYTPNGTTTDVSVFVSIFRPDGGEKFGPPVITTNTTGNTPSTTISTTIPNALAPAIMIAATNVANTSSFNFPADTSGNAPWTPTYFSSYYGMFISYKITTANSNQTYAPTFNSSTAYQTLLNVPVLLNVGLASATSNGRFAPLGTLFGIQAAAKSGGSINLTPISQGMTARAGVTSDADVIVSLNIQPRLTSNDIVNGLIINSYIYSLSLSLTANSNGRILLSTPQTLPLSLQTQAISNGNISLNAAVLTIPATRGAVTSQGSISTQMFTSVDGLTISAKASGIAGLSEKFNFQSILIQSVYATSNANVRLSSPVLGPILLQAASNANIFTSSVIRISPLAAQITTTGYFDPLASNFNNINLRLNLSATTFVDENITLVIAIPSAPFDGTWAGIKSNANSTIALRSPISSIINTSSNGFINPVYAQPFRLIANVTSESDMLSSVTYNPIAIGGESSSGSANLIFDVPRLSTSASAGVISSAGEKFNFQTRPILQVTTTSNSAERIVFNTRIINSINAMSGANSVVGATTDIAPLPSLIAIARGNANSTISIALPISLNINAIASLAEKFNFQTRIIQSTNDIANGLILSSSIMPVRSTTNALSTGYADPVINQGYTTQLAISNLIAKSGLTEKFNFQSLPTLTLNATASLAEKFNFQTRVVQSVNTVSNSIERISLNLSVGSPKAFTTASGYADPLINQGYITQLAISRINAKSCGTENITVVRAIVIDPNTLAINLIADTNGFIGIVQRNNIALVANTIANSFANPSHRSNLSIQASINSNGYSDPLLAPTFTLTTGSKATGVSGLNVTLSTTFSPSSNLIATPNLAEKFNFQSRIVQSVNTIANANSNIAQRIAINAQAQLITNGYVDPLFISNNVSTTQSTAIIKSNANVIASTAFSPTANLIAISNLSEKFNFQSRIVQSINTTSNGNSFVVSGQPLRLLLNAQSNGYVDPTINSVQIINISAQAFVKSGGAEKFDLVNSLVPGILSVSFADNLIQDGAFELGSTYWRGINNTVSVVSSDQGNSLRVNSSFQDFNQEPAGSLGAYQTFNVVAGYKYQLSAIVQNTAGSNPRDMYVQITWPDGKISKGALTSINSANGWVGLNVSGTSEITGLATAYIVTSTPFDSFNATDLALIDNVSVYAIAAPAAPYISAGVRATGNAIVQSNYRLSSALAGTTNNNLLVGIISRISPMGAQGIDTGYFDPLVSSFGTFNVGPITLGVKTNLNSIFSLAYSPILTINAIGNGAERFRFVNNIVPVANVITNGNNAIGISYRVQPNTASALSSGYIDPLLNSINISTINLQLQAKSSGIEKLSLVQTFSTATQIVPNVDNQLQDTSFELGSSSYWYGINNYIAAVSSDSYDGTKSLSTYTLNAYDEYVNGPLGVAQNFVAAIGRTYKLSAYVKNTSGATPRNMLVSIRWNNNFVSSGLATPVSSTDGWVKLEVTAMAPTAGVANALIITSTPFESLGGDTSLIDNVALNITDTFGPIPYIGISAKSNANIRTTFPLSITSLALATTNSSLISAARYTIPLIAGGTASGEVQVVRNIPISLRLHAISSASYPRSSVLQISSVQAFSNANSNIVTSYRPAISANVTSNGTAPDILPNRVIDISPLNAGVKSGGQESLTLVEVIITNQPPSIPGNLVLDPEFALGSQYWSGITNTIEVTQEYAYSGTQSLLVKAVDISEPEYLLPLGARQQFNAVAGRDYVLSAYVRNINGDSRNMSVRLTWANGQTDESVLRRVSQADGWVKLEVTGNARITGPATLYIVTSNAFIPFATDTAVIDAISLTVADVAPFTVNATIKSGGNGRFALTSAITSQIVTTSNLSSIIRSIYRLPLSINAISEADGVFNYPITLGALQASAKVYTAEAFSLTSTFKVPDNLGDTTISLIADSDAFIRIRVINSLDGSSIVSTGNSAEKFNFQSRLISQAGVTSLGSADLAVTTLGNIRLFAGMRSGADVITTMPIDLQYINGIANVSGKERFNFQSIIVNSTNSTSNGLEVFRHVSRISPVANIQSVGYGDLSIAQPSSIKPLIAGGTSGGDITISVDRPLEPLSAGLKSNAFIRAGITFPLVPGERVNLIRNGSFEEGTKYWNSISNYNTISKDFFYEGTQSILITDNDWGNSGIWQEFNAYAGANYTFSAYVRNITGLDPRSMQLQIAWADGTTSASEPKLIFHDAGWVRLELITQAGRGKSGKATATIIVSALPDALVESNAVSAVDAVVLTDESFVSDYFENLKPTGTFLISNANGRINPSVNHRLTLSANVQSNGGFYQDPRSILLNTNFENGTAYWTGINNYVTATDSVDLVLSGKQSVILTSLNTYDEFPEGPFGISQNFMAYANRRYTLSAYIRNLGGVELRNMYAQIRWANGTASVGQVSIVDLAAQGWTRVEVSGISPVQGSAIAQIVTSSPFGGINGGDIAAVDSVSIVEEYIPMQFIRLTGLSAGATSRGYVDPTITSTGTFSPYSNAIANVSGNAVVRLISDISGTTLVDSTNAIIRTSSIMPIGPIRAQAQSVTLGNFEPFNPGLIIPQFSRGFAKVGGDIQIAVEYGIASNATVKVNLVEKISTQFIVSELIVAKSGGGGRPNLSSDPGLITQLVPYDIKLVGGMKTFGQIFVEFGGNVADFIGWGQPL